MTAFLPPVCLALLAYWLRSSSRANGTRAAILAATVILGVGIVLSLELLSLFDAVAGTSLAVSWTVAMLISAALAVQVGRPLKLLPRDMPRVTRSTVLLTLPTALIVLLTGLVAALAWPNTSDALAYHLARVMHWAQNGSVAFYPTNILRQLFNPPWGEYAVLHLVLLGGSDKVASLVQWLSMLGSLLGVSLIAKQLGAAAGGQLAAALVCATIPMGILQASSTQVDYVAAFWLACLAYWLLALRERPDSGWRALAAGAALGLALLSKGTAYPFALPFLVLFLWPARGMAPAVWPRQLALVGLVALALNAPHYIRNLAVFGSPLGPADSNRPKEWQLGTGLLTEAITPALFASNLVRNAALHFGTPWPGGTTSIEQAIERGHVALGVDVKDPRSTWRDYGFDIPDFNTNEGLAGSPLHLALIVGSLAAVAGSGGLRRRPPLAAYTLATFLAYLLFSLLIKWQPWQARLQLPLFVLWAPVIGLLLARKPRLLGGVALALVALSVPFLFENRSHPLVGEGSVLRAGRTEQMFRYRPTLRGGYLEAARQVRALGCEDVGLVLDWDDWELPFWVLLPEARVRGRIEHVAVSTSAATLAEPQAVPCAVLMVGGGLPDSLVVEGRAFRRAWSGGWVKLLTPSG